jgi:maltooligosyltrehalose trehalohydrolase
MKFQVWSPFAKSIELVLENGALEMTRGAHDWWSIAAPNVGDGAKYQFRVDGAGPFPDPRSPWQPHGVHGPSIVIDHSSFRWEDEDFVAKPLAEAVIYELHVGTFTPEGTYMAAADRLGYLRDLGFTHVELMPLASFPGARGWGYDGVALYAPHPAYGTPDELRRSSSTRIAWASPCCSTSFTTISAPMEITSACSARISRAASRRRGATR